MHGDSIVKNFVIFLIAIPALAGNWVNLDSPKTVYSSREACGPSVNCICIDCDGPVKDLDVHDIVDIGGGKKALVHSASKAAAKEAAQIAQEAKNESIRQAKTRLRVLKGKPVLSNPEIQEAVKDLLLLID